MTKHFFLIDDDEDELEIFMEAVSRLPFPCKCTFAQSAEQALDILSYLIPDIVFVDVNMPRVNGFECIKKIRSKVGHENTCLVVYSNGINETAIESAKLVGATLCIKKTNSISDLVSAMEVLVFPTDQLMAGSKGK
ncbi:MAG TPA: response regulator [Flavitalea sp.]|nr:response regulator [Flavitalea sp.]HTF31975.1 response regulator [Flavitalea sp.]